MGPGIPSSTVGAIAQLGERYNGIVGGQEVDPWLTSLR